MLCALLFLHELGLIHRDLKPENVLLTNDGCKLADLGLIINQREEAANTCLGTFDYMVRPLWPHLLVAPVALVATHSRVVCCHAKGIRVCRRSSVPNSCCVPAL